VSALGKPRPIVVRLAILGALVVHAATWHWLPEIREWFNARYAAWLAGHLTAHPELAKATVYPLSGSLPLLLAFTGVVVFPAYYLVSLLLPTVCNAVHGERDHLGRAYGVNTLAFCVGAVSFTWIAPGVNLFYAVKLLFVVVATAAGVALTLRPGAPVSRVALGVALFVVCVGVFAVPRGFDPSFFPADELPARHPVRALKSDGTHTTYVVEDPEGDVLYFDSHPMSGTGLLAQRYMRLMAHVPLLAQSDPRRALLICFGVGNTARAIAAHESIETIDIVDLNDRVFETAVEFSKVNARVYEDPRVRMIHDDGRSYLERTRETYDLVTSEPPPPRSAGVYRLYSVEYYQSVLERLTPNGMMTQWLPLNVLSGEAADRIVASFVSVFPHALLFVGSDDQLVLVGGRQRLDPVLLEQRFESSAGARRDLADIGIHEPVALLARITRIGDGLRADVQQARKISDERNDLAHVVTDPFDPPAVRIDPKAVFLALASENLACSRRLAEVLSNPRQMREVVPDFPFALVR
jgi:spermidine synthase